ncbi:MAG: aldo/keto reductase [Deltaproteobacteria bacterium]|nr:aldo/keto reductase [Deltaproteobacteria bacterium]
MFSKPRNAAIACLAFALVAGYFVLGHYLYKVPIGLDQSGFIAGEAMHSIATLFVKNPTNSLSGAVLLLLVFLGIGAVCFFVARTAVRNRAADVDPSRRSFLTGAGTGAGVALGSMVVAGGVAAARGLLGVGHGGKGWAEISKHINDKDVVFTDPNWQAQWKGSRVQNYRRFGRTGWNVSDIVLGTGRIHDEDGEKVARLAIERGVNYIDTSPDYSAAGSENAVGRAIVGKRDQLFIATKFCTPIGHLAPGTSVAHYKRAVEASLERLGTDYVDLCHIHSCDSVERLMDENVHEAFDQLKAEGKVRFLGVSSHTPNLVEVANTAIDSGRFDVMMLAYHRGVWAPLPDIISRARAEQDMGIVAMKTLKGAKHQGLADFRDEADAYSQAALKWTLSNQDVSCAVISFFKPQHVDEYLYASGKQVTPADVAVLDEYDRRILGSYCGPHCGVCLGSCPEELAINDVLRHRMYFEDYGWEKEGMRLYSQLEKSAAACASCSAPCLGSCPVGVPIQERMNGAHRLLTLS